MKVQVCVLAALLSTTIFESHALTIKSKFTDDLVKSLAEDLNKDANQESSLAQKEAKAEKKVGKQSEIKKSTNNKADSKKTVAKKAEAKKKEEDTEIPMDTAAIKAYSSVIADAAEDSEPAVPVQYGEVIHDEEQRPSRLDFNPDPMGSMIQNEISAIKDASIKAAK